MKVATLEARYPNITFIEGETFMYSPKDTSVMYDPKRISKESGIWSLLHEIGHALANHETFKPDLELIKLEREAWRHARSIGETLDIEIDEDHIQDLRHGVFRAQAVP